MVKKFKDEKHRDKIVDRICKVLAVAEGTQFQAEAETAMKMAQNYMKTYGLSLSEIELKEELKEEIIKRDVERNVVNQELWERKLCTAIGIVFDCRILLVPTSDEWRGYKAAFIGYEKDVELASVVFNCLYVSAKATANKLFPKDLNSIRSFLAGFGDGMLCRVHKEKAEAEKIKAEKGKCSYALVVVSKEKKIEEWVNNEYKTKSTNPKSTQKNTNMFAYSMGELEADKTDLMDKEKLK